MARLYKKGISAVSVKGRQYSADEEGVVEVPDDVADHLIVCFGLRDIGTGPPEPEPAETGKTLRLGREHIEEDAVSADSNIDKPCTDKPCALEGGYGAAEGADGAHSLHLRWKRGSIYTWALDCDVGNFKLSDAGRSAALGAPPNGSKCAASLITPLAALLIGHRANAPPKKPR
jgi:hypothetical protein